MANGHGGARPGSGRKPTGIVEAQRSIMDKAKEHAETALATLVEIARHGDTAAARVSAANALLDRGYGKAPQAVEHSGEMTFTISSKDAGVL